MKTTVLSVMKNLAIGIAFAGTLSAQTTADFENFNLKYWDGSAKPSGVSFQSGSAQFRNYFNPSFGGYWSDGWAYSQVKDSVTGDYTNIYGAKTGGAYSRMNYAVGKDGAILVLTDSSASDTVRGAYITNGTYPYTSIKNGDGFGKKFGGTTGNDPDWFKLTIKAYSSGLLGTDSVEFYLADYRFSDNTKDYIVKNWTWIDLTKLGKADSLLFSLSSSDVGLYGMNTPGFFCMDNLQTKKNTSTFDELMWYWNGMYQPMGTDFKSGNVDFPNDYETAFGGYWLSGWSYSAVKDSVTPDYTNLYASRTGSGYNGSDNYAIGTQGSIARIQGPDAGKAVDGFYISNTTYDYFTMLNGYFVAKKFGGVSGNDPDWFKLTVKKYLGGVLGTDSVEFYLADFRFTDNSKDYIVKDWKWVGLTSLGNADSLLFTLSSSDNDIVYGMNTPAYFAMDNLTTGSITTSIDNSLVDQKSLFLYPVPAKDVLYINSGKAVFNQYEIYDMKGARIDGMKNSSINSINIESLASGIYVLVLRNENELVQQKFVKQ